MKAPLLAVLVLATMNAQAASDHFVCVVKSENALQKDGTVSTKKIDKNSVFFEQTFVVDRVSGSVRGKILSNDGAEQTVILDNGKNPQNAFHMYWTGTKLVSAPFWYLYIESFIQPKSPFIYIGPGGHFSGLCN